VATGVDSEMRSKIYKRGYNQFIKNEYGFSLIEALIALAIMALVSVVFLYAVQTLIYTSHIDTERVTATRLAESQMEYVKMQDYNPLKSYTKIPSEGTDYYIGDINAIWYDPSTGGEDVDGDKSIQKITVKVYKGPDASGELLITLEGFKRKRQ
jgi:prepilin-type N-terminal cleavage/methylation domain-containing protein